MKITLVITLLLQSFFTYGQNSVSTDYILIHDIKPGISKSVSSMLISKDVKSEDYEVLKFKVKEKTLSEMLSYIRLFRANTLAKKNSKLMKYDWQSFEIIYFINNKYYKKFISESECNSLLQELAIINEKNSENNNLNEYLEYARKLITLP